MFGKTAILLVNLGTPDAPTRGAVYRYLKEFLLDKRVLDVNFILRNFLVRGIIAPFRSGKSAQLYQKLWTAEGSPLKVFGYKLVEMVKERMGNEYIVELAMRYQTPSIQSVLDKMMQQQVSKIIVLPLFPQYASATTGSVHEEVMRCLSAYQIVPELSFINSYYDNPNLISAFVDKSKDYLLENYEHVLFSFHGLPKRQLRKADTCGHCFRSENCCENISIKNQHCYSAQCYSTAQAIAQKLAIPKEKYTICFQSRLGRDPWLQPYTSDILKQRYKLGDKNILVFCPAFVSDCLETTIEIGEEYAEEWHELGGERLDLVEGLNDSPIWADTVCELLKDRLKTTEIKIL
jgi:protoporphyrin/coproporphyrin ferrochelatase